MITATPEEVGFSSERLARIDRHLLARYIEPGKIAGALTVVSRHGEIVHATPLGRRDLDRDQPMQEDTIFRIYSMTKPVTSVALMSLVEEGHLAISDPVHRFIPEWRDLRVFAQGNHPHFLTTPCDRAMTVKDLLTHTSGLTYGFMERTNVDAAYRKLAIGDRKEGATLANMMHDLAGLPLEFSPGTAWNYSVATDVLGHIVEVVSGQSYDAFLRERIFGPLDMRDTGFQVPREDVGRFAANYARRRNKSLKLEDDPRTSVYTRDVTFFSGGGGLVSTGRDYMRFCQMLLNGGELDGARILGRKTIDWMTMNHLPGNAELSDLAVGRFAETPYDGRGFGLGFSVTTDPSRSVTLGSAGEYAWGGAASTIFWVDPVEDLTVVFLTQLMPSATFDFRGQLMALVYSALVD